MERHLELSLELIQLGRPMVIALNMMDEAWNKGLHINAKTLSALLGIPVVATVAHMGHGIAELFNAATDAVREAACPWPQPASPHICTSLQPLSRALNLPAIRTAFRIPHPFLLTQLAAGDDYILDELKMHFPALLPELLALRTAAERQLPHAVVDGLIGLVGIVVPYMLPLVMLLVTLEQIGIMQRIAFVVDRGFHHIGLHGGVAVPFLLGLGCNISAIKRPLFQSRCR